jgi:hypothetical protein
MITFHSPIEINIKNKKNYSGPGEYIGRPSILGNPFIIGRDGNRTEVIEKYKIYFHERLSNDLQFQNYVILLSQELIRSKKLDLICWCSPCACHGDIIKKLLMEIIDD